MDDFITEEIDGKLWLKSYTGHEKIVNIPEGIQVIDGDDIFTEDDPRTSRKGAFFGNKDIQIVYFPKSVETIRMDAFAGCDNLEKVHAENELSYFEGPFNLYETNPDEKHTVVFENAFDSNNKIQRLICPNSYDYKIHELIFNESREHRIDFFYDKINISFTAEEWKQLICELDNEKSSETLKKLKAIVPEAQSSITLKFTRDYHSPEAQLTSTDIEDICNAMDNLNFRDKSHKLSNLVPENELMNAGFYEKLVIVTKA